MEIEAVDSKEDIQGEAEFIEGLLEGVDRSWRHFHTRYDRLIYRCITSVTSRFAFVTNEDIREIYATLLVGILSNDMSKLRRFDRSRGSRFSSWLGLLSVNAAYDYLRRLRREPRRAPIAEAEALGCNRPSPLDMLENAERTEQFEKMLQTLSAKDREFVALFFGEGLGPQVVAERMQISVKTVHSRRHKIKCRLEAMLALAA